jgi:hypothetical protein
MRLLEQQLTQIRRETLAPARGERSSFLVHPWLLHPHLNLTLSHQGRVASSLS